MREFKVGDEITYSNAGYTGIIKRIKGDELWCDWSNGSSSTYVTKNHAILVKKGKPKSGCADYNII